MFASGKAGRRISADPADGASRADEERREPTPQALFDRVAAQYDRFNTVLSLGGDRQWRRIVARALPAAPGLRVLDAACGTGAVGEAVRRLHPQACISGVDLNEAMLRQARLRRAQVYASLQQANVEELPFTDASFDAVVIAFAFHDFEDRLLAARELRRVIVPGGTLIDLELSLPQVRVLRRGYIAGLRVMTLLGRAGDLRGYAHLRDEITHSPDDSVLIGIVQGAGFECRGVDRLAGGLTTLYRFTASEEPT